MDTNKLAPGSVVLPLPKQMTLVSAIVMPGYSLTYFDRSKRYNPYDEKQKDGSYHYIINATTDSIIVTPDPLNWPKTETEETGVAVVILANKEGFTKTTGIQLLSSGNHRILWTDAMTNAKESDLDRT